MIVIVTSLALFALTWLLVFEEGPYNILTRLRMVLGVSEEGGVRSSRNQLGMILNCPVCLSVWLSVPVVLIGLLVPELLYPLASVGIVILLSGVMNGS